MASHITVSKFGGTSIQDRAAFERVARIVSARQSSSLVVVVSAMSGVTDALIESFQTVSTRGVNASLALVEQHLERHLRAGEALSPTRCSRLQALVDVTRTEIAELLEATVHGPSGVQDRHTCEMQTHDAIASHGERLAAHLLTLVLEERGIPAEYVDARRCVITNDEHGNARPLLAEVSQRTAAELLPLLQRKRIPVLGGFIGATEAGVTTTLGRGSSDYSATLIGAALHAREIEIWTDVDGIQTADPRLVQTTRTVPHISYAEAAQLAKLGARVMHPKMIEPVLAEQIPIRILNSHAPQQPGTLISAASAPTNGRVKAIAHKISGATAVVGCIGHGLRIKFMVEPDAVGVIVRDLHAAIFE